MECSNFPMLDFWRRMIAILFLGSERYEWNIFCRYNLNTYLLVNFNNITYKRIQIVDYLFSMRQQIHKDMKFDL